MKTTFVGKNYIVTVADGTETINGHECYSGQLIITHPQGTEVFDTFQELVETHPITEEARKALHPETKIGVTVRADYENNAELFWDTIREKHPAIAEKLQANANVFLTDEEWETVQAVEGFEDGPNYARTALLEVEE